jgi:small conductance mechanosensitive channel
MARAGRRHRRWIPLRLAALAVAGALPCLLPLSASSQDLISPDPTAPAAAPAEPIEPRQPVQIVPSASDQEIADRIARILAATGWFTLPRVSVQDGVVVLDGAAGSQEHRRWAGNLAESTEGAVAVVNRIEVEADVRTTFGQAGDEITRLARQAAQAWPIVLLGMLIILFAWLFSRLVGAAARRFFAGRIPSPLLLAVVVRLFSIPVFLLGIYFVLQIAGLTRLAITVLGGTGLVGIVIGFAFRDIAENFLASLLLSVRNPFQSGDLIEVAGHTGVVQNLNTRSTVLLTLDGNHVQIPNSTVFKNTITNYTSTPRRRAQFKVGIGYDSPIAGAQALITGVLNRHTAVLDDPEPLVLVDELDTATVNLKIMYWFDSSVYAPDKINSALMRQTKRALMEGGIELPDAAREVVFPKGVPLVQPGAGDTPPAGPMAAPAAGVCANDAEDTTEGEGNLLTKGPDARGRSRDEIPEASENLLKS